MKPTTKRPQCISSRLSAIRLRRTFTILTLFITCINLLIANHRNMMVPNGSIMYASCHIVLTKDDHSQSLVLTGEDGRGGKGGKGEGGDQLVIAGNNMGSDGQDSRMIMQDASNREGDVVINGNSMIIPGEDGHIVLADSRRRENNQRPAINPWIYWLPYMNNRFTTRMMSFSNGFYGK